MYSEQLEALDDEIEAALEPLTPRQRKFALAYSTGQKTRREALLEAGYAESTADKQRPSQLVNVRPAMSLINRRYLLEHGETVAQHRTKLTDLYELCADPTSERWDARTAHQIRRTLAEFDGHIKGSGNAGVAISINVVDPVAGITIEAQEGSESVSACIEPPCENAE